MKQDKCSMAERIKAVPSVCLDYVRRPQVWGFFLSLVVMAFISLAFFYPDAGAGNQLRQPDMQQGAAIGQEVKEYVEAHPDAPVPRWTNSLFGGMPTFQISPTYPSDSLFSWITTVYGAGLPSPSNLLFMMMAGMLIMLMCMRVRWYYALIGAVAWGFSSYFIIIIGAGHIWKFVTLAYIPPTIGGIVLAYRGRWLVGGALAALFAMMQIQSNHVQMSYYFMFVVLAMVICYAVDAIRRKKYATFLKATGALAVAAILAVCANLPSLYNTYEYSKQTMRGQHSELTAKAADNGEGADAASESTSGLDRSYITQYSYGQSESFSLLIPNVKGGASARPHEGQMMRTSLTELIDDDSKEVTGLNDVERFALNYYSQYFGEPEGTNGPVYVGAVIFALFALGLIIVRGPLKWSLLAVTLLSVFLALGRNMQWFTDLFIDYVPMYSKFRTVESILVVAEFAIPVLAILALQKVLTAPKHKRKSYLKATYVSFGVVAFICLLGWLFPSIFGSGISDADEYAQYYAAQDLLRMGYPMEEVQQLLPYFSLDNANLAYAVTELRYGMVSADSLRSLIFVALTFGVVWFSLSNKNVKAWQAATIVGILVLADLYTVDKRYLNHDAFTAPVETSADLFPMSDIDRQILADTTMNYRVMDIPQFGAPAPSYYHKMIGGYHAAKLTRYQDLIDRHLSHFTQGNPTQQDFEILNMLNAKYIVSPDGQLMVNPDALGNAWFVDRVVWADSPDDEMAALDTISPAVTAVADKQFRDALPSADKILREPADTIYETTYAPGRLTYRAHTAKGGVAVFSEVYFPWGWNATIDGKPAKLARVNYLLRAMEIPAGDHVVEMNFDPKSVSTTIGIARWSVIAIYLALFVAIISIPLSSKCKNRNS